MHINYLNQAVDTDTGLAARFRKEDLVSFRLFDLVRTYISETKGQRLLLPTIQRSLVWTNEQIVNYWDSLFRGWFPGLMLVHEANESGVAYNSQGYKRPATTGDFELLDGQQRMAAILLGFGIGPLAETRRLWIDLDARPEGKLCFSIRVTSPGQPFGYQSTAPNSKLDIDKSRKAWDSWLFGTKANEVDWEKPQQIIDAMRDRYEEVLSAKPKYQKLPDSGATDDDVSKRIGDLRPEAFSRAMGTDLSGAGGNMFPLAPLLRNRAKDEAEGAALWPIETPVAPSKYELEAGEAFDKLPASNANANALRDRLGKVLGCKIAIKNIGKELSQERGDYEEFFKRIGQGGTSLSDDELSYSLIKARIPPARQALEKIVGGGSKIGRLASPTQIALAGLRLARMRVLGGNKNIWEAISRPSPDFISGLSFEIERAAESKSDKGTEKEKRLAELARTFVRMLSSSDNDNEHCELHSLMLKLRELLGGIEASDVNADRGSTFPAILLGRLPKELIDIGLMLVGLDDLSKINDKMRRAFCLWCLTFGDAASTANELAREAIGASNKEGEKKTSNVLQEVIGTLEKDGHAKWAPTCEDLEKLSKAVLAPPCQDEPLLHDAKVRFTSAGVDLRISSAINEFNFASNRGKNALLWVQRNYLHRHFPAYDPTSDRDEDLPIDLDHIVPSERFGFHWKEAGFPFHRDDEQQLKYPADDELLNNLGMYRKEVGNLLGNLRWLSSSENRSHGAKLNGGGEETLMGKDDVTDIKVPVAGYHDNNSVGGDNNFINLKAAIGVLIDLKPKKPGGVGLSGWSVHDVRLWQYMVEARQLELIRRLICESAIGDLLPAERPTN